MKFDDALARLFLGEPFEPTGCIECLTIERVIVVGFAEVGFLLKRFVDRGAQAVSDEFADFIDIRQWNVHHATDVADCRTGFECAEGNNLRDMPILLARPTC